MQAHITPKNYIAKYVYCGNHDLNLILGDLGTISAEASSFFGVLQKIYNCFASSTKRWDILKQFVKQLTPKPLSDGSAVLKALKL